MARRPSPRSLTAPAGSRPSTSSPAPATPGSRRPSARFTASSASTWSQGPPRSSSSRTRSTIPNGPPPTCSAKPEHDVTTQSILFTDDAAFADKVADAVDRQLSELATEAVARVAWDANGAIIVVDTLADAIPLVDRLAAEHLQLAIPDPQGFFDRIRHAGSVFLGRYTPEAIGDYVAGPNHVLPTGRRARFASGLSVLDFMKRTSFLALDEAALRELGPATVALANAEGLPAHAKSVALRLRLNH